ncbi:MULTISPECIES: hypothetical protein [unclassified Massilia]|uniref:hypothetical protein n=1 Tax=unclassified Massilia TaxID=2609279 RepID=UPI00177DDB70|nr:MULTISPECIES: hypothetical protein [unclassified Massilia]MBD8532122.1 hypothetical protein [Massilia sp. CFBP 13647]MBD8675620.1 hypothetical protein [Massilia sp. CFBP 13721]
MKNEKLTTDEYNALEFIRRGARTDRVNACVGRNAKRLAGLKMIAYARDGRVDLTEKGQQVLFLRACVEALTSLSGDPAATVAGDVAQFLVRKSHIAPREDGGFDVTPRGLESLADIQAQEPKK